VYRVVGVRVGRLQQGRVLLLEEGPVLAFLHEQQLEVDAWRHLLQHTHTNTQLVLSYGQSLVYLLYLHMHAVSPIGVVTDGCPHSLTCRPDKEPAGPMKSDGKESRYRREEKEEPGPGDSVVSCSQLQPLLTDGRRSPPPPSFSSPSSSYGQCCTRLQSTTYSRGCCCCCCWEVLYSCSISSTAGG
jgi:hypothetical protein